MAEFIRRREHHEERQYRLLVQRKGEPYGNGCMFDCDAAGSLVTPERHAQRLAELARDEAYDAPAVVSFVHRWTTPAAVRCRCGAEVELHGFTNACECGIDYNMSGQELAPREQWGEETGEDLGDILRIP